MSISLTGTLISPTGEVAANAGIRVTSLALGVNDLGKGVITEYQCSPAGAYTFNLVFGSHRIEYRFENEWLFQADVVVNDQTPVDIGTLSNLFATSVPATPEIIQQMQQILADAEAAAETASDEADRATTAASTVGDDADRAEAAAQSASSDATIATQAKGDAEAAALAATDAFDNFDDKYLGSKTTPPTVDNDGDPLQVGMTYWNETDGTLYYYNGAEWESPDKSASASAASALNSATVSTQAKVDAEAAALAATDDADRAETAAQSASSDATIGRVTSARELDVSKNTVGEMLAASGFVHMGNQIDNPAWATVNQGMWCNRGGEVTATNAVYMGTQNSAGEGESKTIHPVINVANVISKLEYLNSGNGTFLNAIKFPPAPDGTVTYDSTTYTRVQHADAATAFAAETATNKVVTERQDLPFLEGFKEEVTVTNPYVYRNGLIQSQATEMNGITTTRSNRPDSYYAVYDGDTTSAGLGVNYFTASTTQKALMLADPDNNLEIGVDGKVYQWRIRQRTVDGAGNGEWENIDPSTSEVESLRWDSNSLVVPQGVLDSVPSDSGTYSYRGTNLSLNDKPHAGVFTVKNTDATSIAVNGECFALVLPPVNRLNKGMYHPSFNSAGSAYDVNHNSWKSTVLTVLSKADCWPPSDIYDGAIGQLGDPTRPDGKYHDAIYADGQGGVDKDVRLSAWDCRNEASNQDTANKNGTARGHEKLVRTQLYESQLSDCVNGWTIENGNVTDGWISGGGFLDGLSVGDIVYVVVAGSIVAKMQVTVANLVSGDAYYHRGVWLDGFTPPSPTLAHAAGQYVVYSVETNNTVSGEFTTKDVIGDPANILATSDLANGWMGNWVPVIPDGVINSYGLTRKEVANAATLQQVRTPDNGASWITGNAGFNSVTNTVNTTPPTGNVVIINYTAKAYVTEPANNPVVFGGTEGIGDVYAGLNYTKETGCTFNESLLKTITKNGNNPRLNTLKLEEVCWVFGLSQLVDSPIYGETRHQPITLGQPTNDSHACKALNLIGEENGQLWNYYLAEELIWDGNGWGDDNTIKVVNGEVTGTDLNGNTVKRVCHRSVEPIGWIKNDK